MKKVVIIARTLPFNSIRNSEALRCAVGMTLEEENKVQVIFLGDGVWTAALLDSKAASSHDLGKHVETLEMMEAELVAEEEALNERGIKVNREEINVKSRQAIDEAIKDADVVIPF
jgi:tRNA 2-thiouridine synthesizing protein C